MSANWNPNTSKWKLAYAMKGCADEFAEGPFKNREAAEMAGRRKKGTGLLRWWAVWVICDDEVFEEVLPS